MQETSLEERVYSRAVRLQNLSKDIKGIFDKPGCRSPVTTRIGDAVELVRGMARQIDGCYLVFVGDIAAIQYDRLRMTDSIQAVVDAAHHEFLVNALLNSDPYSHGAKIDLFKEGMRLGMTKRMLPHPNQLGPHLGYAHLHGLILMDLISGRRQDLCDVIELLNSHQSSVDVVSPYLPEDLRKEFLELAEVARCEAN